MPDTLMKRSIADTLLHPKGYWSIVDIHIDRKSESLYAAEPEVSLLFKDTNDPRRKALATVPCSLATPDWPLEVFLQFNTNRPEALRHTKEAINIIQRLYDGTA